MTPLGVACFRRRCRWIAAPLEVVGEQVFICRAYPGGIPEDILSGKDLHLEARGDEIEAVTYEPEGKTKEVRNAQGDSVVG